MSLASIIGLTFVMMTTVRASKLLISKTRLQSKMGLLNIPLAKDSAWRTIRDRGTDEGWLAVTSMTRAAVEQLYKFAIEPYLPNYRKGGRPPRLSHLDYLALTLYFLHTRSELNTIALIFGCSLSTCSRNIDYILNLIIQHLPNHPEAAVRWPSNDEFQQFGSLVERKIERSKMDFSEPFTPFAFVDGCDFHIKHSVDLVEKDHNYNNKCGYPKVGNLFVWAPTGKVVYCFVNAPGRLHDGELALDLYELLNSNSTPPGYVLLADQGFKVINGKTVCTASITESDEGIRLTSKEVARLRAASEWGNAGLQRCWARLTLRLPVDPQARRLLILAAVYLYNFRTGVIGRNQIRTTYCPEWLGNWRLARPGPSGQQQYWEKAQKQANAKELEANAKEAKAKEKAAYGSKGTKRKRTQQ